MKLLLHDGNELPYISVPVNGQLIQVREDYFDDLPNDQYEQVLEAIRPYNEGMSGLFSGFIERQKEKRQARQDYKLAKTQAKQDARTDRSANRASILGGVLGTVKNIISSGDAGSASSSTNLPSPGIVIPDDGAPIQQPFFKTTTGKVVIGAGVVGLGLLLIKKFNQ